MSLNKDIKEIVIVLAQYYPSLNPNVYRWQAIAEYWVKQGKKITIITTERRGSETLEKHNGVEVLRSGYHTLNDWFQNKWGSKERRNELGKQNTTPSKFRKIIEEILDKTYRKRYWPDGSYKWIEKGVKLLNSKIEESKPDLIISVGLPFSAHLIARRIKERYNDIQWIMDIEDPFSYSKEFWVNNFERYEEKNIREEKRAFKLAEAISVTNPRAKEKYLELFNDYESKIGVIPPLLNVPKNIPRKRNENEDKKQIVFIGSFYKNVRSPRSLLELIIRLSRTHPEIYESCEFKFYGQQNPWSSEIFQSFKSLKQVQLMGLVSRPEVFSILQSADLIINISNHTDYHLPSKLVDYMWAKKPILNLYSLDNDQSKQFLGSHIGVTNVQVNTIDEDDLFIDCLERLSTTLSDNGSSASLEEYSVENISNQYLKLISDSSE